MNLSDRRRAHLSRSAALTLSAAFMLVPANLLPVLSTQISGQLRTDTIFSGIVALCNQGLWPLGAIVFAASILIPLLKIAGLIVLLVAARHGPAEHPQPLTRLYATLDLIGRWSMLDVFLVAFLAGAVQFGAFATVEPRAGIVAFAAAVVLTMLATRAFNPRLLWIETAPAASSPSPSSR